MTSPEDVASAFSSGPIVFERLDAPRDIVWNRVSLHTSSHDNALCYQSNFTKSAQETEWTHDACSDVETSESDVTPVDHEGDQNELEASSAVVKELKCDPEKDTNAEPENAPKKDLKLDQNHDGSVDAHFDPEKDLHCDPKQDTNIDLEKEPDKDLANDPEKYLKLDPESDLENDPDRDSRLDLEKDLNTDLEKDKNLDPGSNLENDPERELKLDPKSDLESDPGNTVGRISTDDPEVAVATSDEDSSITADIEIGTPDGAVSRDVEETPDYSEESTRTEEVPTKHESSDDAMSRDVDQEAEPNFSAVECRFESEDKSASIVEDPNKNESPDGAVHSAEEREVKPSGECGSEPKGESTCIVEDPNKNESAERDRAECERNQSEEEVASMSSDSQDALPHTVGLTEDVPLGSGSDARDLNFNPTSDLMSDLDPDVERRVKDVNENDMVNVEESADHVEKTLDLDPDIRDLETSALDLDTLGLDLDACDRDLNAHDLNGNDAVKPDPATPQSSLEEQVRNLAEPDAPGHEDGGLDVLVDLAVPGDLAAPDAIRHPVEPAATPDLSDLHAQVQPEHQLTRDEPSDSASLEHHEMRDSTFGETRDPTSNVDEEPSEISAVLDLDAVTDPKTISDAHVTTAAEMVDPGVSGPCTPSTDPDPSLNTDSSTNRGSSGSETLRAEAPEEEANDGSDAPNTQDVASAAEQQPEETRTSEAEAAGQLCDESSRPHNLSRVSTVKQEPYDSGPSATEATEVASPHNSALDNLSTKLENDVHETNNVPSNFDATKAHFSNAAISDDVTPTQAPVNGDVTETGSERGSRVPPPGGRRGWSRCSPLRDTLPQIVSSPVFFDSNYNEVAPPEDDVAADDVVTNDVIGRQSDIFSNTDLTNHNNEDTTEHTKEEDSVVSRTDAFGTESGNCAVTLGPVTETQTQEARDATSASSAGSSLLPADVDPEAEQPLGYNGPTPGQGRGEDNIQTWAEIRAKSPGSSQTGSEGEAKSEPAQCDGIGTERGGARPKTFKRDAEKEREMEFQGKAGDRKASRKTDRKTSKKKGKVAKLEQKGQLQEVKVTSWSDIQGFKVIQVNQTTPTRPEHVTPPRKDHVVATRTQNRKSPERGRRKSPEKIRKSPKRSKKGNPGKTEAASSTSIAKFNSDRKSDEIRSKSLENHENTRIATGNTSNPNPSSAKPPERKAIKVRGESGPPGVESKAQVVNKSRRNTSCESSAVKSTGQPAQKQTRAKNSRALRSLVSAAGDGLRTRVEAGKNSNSPEPPGANATQPAGEYPDSRISMSEYCGGVRSIEDGVSLREGRERIKSRSGAGDPHNVSGDSLDENLDLDFAADALDTSSVCGSDISEDSLAPDLHVEENLEQHLEQSADLTPQPAESGQGSVGQSVEIRSGQPADMEVNGCSEEHGDPLFNLDDLTKRALDFADRISDTSSDLQHSGNNAQGHSSAESSAVGQQAQDARKASRRNKTSAYKAKTETQVAKGTEDEVKGSGSLAGQRLTVPEVNEALSSSFTDDSIEEPDPENSAEVKGSMSDILDTNGDAETPQVQGRSQGQRSNFTRSDGMHAEVKGEGRLTSPSKPEHAQAPPPGYHLGPASVSQGHRDPNPLLSRDPGSYPPALQGAPSAAPRVQWPPPGFQLHPPSEGHNDALPGRPVNSRLTHDAKDSFVWSGSGQSGVQPTTHVPFVKSGESFYLDQNRSNGDRVDLKSRDLFAPEETRDWDSDSLSSDSLADDENDAPSLERYEILTEFGERSLSTHPGDLELGCIAEEESGQEVVRTKSRRSRSERTRSQRSGLGALFCYEEDATAL